MAGFVERAVLRAYLRGSLLCNKLNVDIQCCKDCLRTHATSANTVGTRQHTGICGDRWLLSKTMGDTGNHMQPTLLFVRTHDIPTTPQQNWNSTDPTRPYQDLNILDEHATSSLPSCGAHPPRFHALNSRP